MLLSSSLTEAASCCRPPAPRSTGSACTAGGSRSSAPSCKPHWFSWGRWWPCFWSCGGGGVAPGPAESCSGARCCGAKPRSSACSAASRGPAAADPHSGWSDGRSHTAWMTCICGGGGWGEHSGFEATFYPNLILYFGVIISNPPELLWWEWTESNAFSKGQSLYLW